MAAIYFIIWWLVLFTVLPWGIHSQEEHGDFPPGTDPGAPAIHGLRRKMIWTTVVATVVFGLFYWAFVTRAIAFDDLATLWGLLKPPSGR
jgi:predicted secreted protein